jgi:hypothetical protein
MAHSSRHRPERSKKASCERVGNSLSGAVPPNPSPAALERSRSIPYRLAGWAPRLRPRRLWLGPSVARPSGARSKACAPGGSPVRAPKQGSDSRPYPPSRPCPRPRLGRGADRLGDRPARRARAGAAAFPLGRAGPGTKVGASDRSPRRRQPRPLPRPVAGPAPRRSIPRRERAQTGPIRPDLRKLREKYSAHAIVLFEACENDLADAKLGGRSSNRHPPGSHCHKAKRFSMLRPPPPLRSARQSY